MKMTGPLKLFTLATVLLAATVSCSHSSKQGFEGSWPGFNTKRPAEKCTLVITRNQLEFHGVQSNNWCRGTFVLNKNADPKEMDLTIQEPTELSGKMTLIIYTGKGDEMTVAASRIGSGQRPASFTPDWQTDVLNFKRD